MPSPSEANLLVQAAIRTRLPARRIEPSSTDCTPSSRPTGKTAIEAVATSFNSLMAQRIAARSDDLRKDRLCIRPKVGFARAVVQRSGSQWR